MADTLDFENILKIIKENNPKSIELWQNRKISGAKTLFNSPYKHKIVDEVRFKLKGGVQIAFIGDDEQEKLIKIVGGRDKAQKTLNYIKKCSAENSENLSDEDKVLLDILNTSLKKYIKLLRTLLMNMKQD